MSSLFEAAVTANSFSLTDIGEKKFHKDLICADDLVGYINKFLPYQFTTNHGKKAQFKKIDDTDEGATQETATLAFGKTSRAKTIEELHKRIETLRGKKINYKEKLLKKGLKNRLKKKQKLEERKQLKNSARKQNSEQTETADDTNDGNDVKKEQIAIKPAIKFNKIVLDHSEINVPKHGTDPKRRLQQIEKKKEKLKKLEIKGKKEKLIEIKTKEAWDTAIQKVEGVKIKDNVDLLKKAILSKQNRKNKSKKKWEDREKQETKKKDDTQKKRMDNINKKKKERSKKRKNVLVKKGRILPQ